MERTALEQLKPVVVREELLMLQKEAQSIHVDESLKRYIVAIVSATRTHRDISLGASPRASAALMRAAQAKAFLQGRTYAIPDDVKELAEPVLAHRLLLTAEARLAGRTAMSVLRAVMQAEPIPAASVPSAG
jgi:MoxR-like ATPase